MSEYDDADTAAFEAYRASNNPKKVYLGDQTYKDDSGSPFVFKMMKSVENDLCKAMLDKARVLPHPA